MTFSGVLGLDQTLAPKMRRSHQSVPTIFNRGHISATSARLSGSKRGHLELSLEYRTATQRFLGRRWPVYSVRGRHTHHTQGKWPGFDGRPLEKRLIPGKAIGRVIYDTVIWSCRTVFAQRGPLKNCDKGVETLCWFTKVINKSVLNTGLL